MSYRYVVPARILALVDALAALPVFAVRVIAKFQAHDIGILGDNCAAKARHGIVIPGFGDGDFDAAQ